MRPHPILSMALLIGLLGYCSLYAQPITRSYDLAPVKSISLNMDAKVVLVPSASQQVIVTASGPVLESLSKEVRNGHWEIKMKNQKLVSTKSYEDELLIEVALPGFSSIAVSSSGTIATAGVFRNLEEVTLMIGGAGNIQLELEASRIHASIGGAGGMTLEGSAKSLHVSLVGSGDVVASNLQVKEGQVNIAGSGDCYIHASHELEVSIVGSGDVYYKGDPALTPSILGSGAINALRVR